MTDMGQEPNVERLLHIVIAELLFIILVLVGLYWEMITLVKLVGGGKIFG